MKNKLNKYRCVDRRCQIAAGLLAAFICFCAYRFFVQKVRQINYRIFNLEETVSWAENENGIYRLEAQGLLDNLLLSADAWKEFTLAFELYHPRDCGIVFHYQNPQDYYFVYFHQPTQSILWARRQGDNNQILERWPLPQQALLKSVLKVVPGSARLELEGFAPARIKIPATTGRFGILINDAANPRTIFYDLRVTGRLANGWKVRGQSPVAYRPGGIRYLGAVFPFYLSLLLLVLWGVYILREESPLVSVKKETWVDRTLKINGTRAGMLHLFLAAVIFCPFLLRQEIFVSSYDNLGEIYPLFFLSKHKFTAMLRTGSWSLWNPYFHNGTPFYSNHWNMIYYPVNWLVFLFSDRHLMTALTARTFIEVFLTGWLAYGFFSQEIRSRFWALFSSVAYQLCSFLIFALSIFPTISLYFSFTLYLYLLWSMPQRSGRWNFFLLALAVYFVMTSANVVFIFYGLLALGVLTLYRLTTLRWNDRRPAMVTVTAAWGTGLLMSAVRIIPNLAAIMNSNRIVQGYYTIHNRLSMALRLFIPEITGWFGPDSFNALMSDKLNLAFRHLDMPSNPQNAFFVYFGIWPALLLVTSLLLKTKGRHSFWKKYAVVTLAASLLLQPFWGMLCILFFPLVHFSYHIIILPIGICCLAGFTGHYLETERLKLKKDGSRLVLVLLFIQASIIVFLTYLFPGMTGWTRGILVIMLVLGGGFYALQRFRTRLARLCSMGTITMVNIMLWALFLFSATLALLQPIPRKEGLTEFGIIPFLTVVGVGSAALWFYALMKPQRPVAKSVIQQVHFFVFGVPMVLFVLFKSGWLPQILSLTEGLRVYATDMLLAQSRLLLISGTGLLALLLFKLRRLSRLAFLMICLVCLSGDLLIFNLRFDNITAPFYHKQAFYDAAFHYEPLSSKLRQQMDLRNFRVHAQHRAGLNANKNVIFGLPSYTGTVGYLSKDFSNIINRFGYPPGTILIYPADIASSQRFLDLSAVRYTIEEGGSVTQRPSALARMNLFYDYEVMADPKAALDRIGQSAFDHLQTVVLESTPSLALNRHVHKPADLVNIKAESTSDHALARVTTSQPAILLFNESYDRGWRAFVDGQAVPLIRANYNFMAIGIPPGSHEVVFRYRPLLFFICLAVSLAAFIAWVCVPLLAGIIRQRFYVK